MFRIDPKGCAATIAFTIALFVLIGAFGCVAFFDASTHQPVEECVAKMQPILEKTAAMPDNAVLESKNAEIEHILYGNESDVIRVAEIFSEQGFKTDVGPKDEVGWGASIFERPAEFRLQPARRIRQLCTVAEQNDVQYRTWWLSAVDLTTYYYQ